VGNIVEEVSIVCLPAFIARSNEAGKDNTRSDVVLNFNIFALIACVKIRAYAEASTLVFDRFISTDCSPLDYPHQEISVNSNVPGAFDSNTDRSELINDIVFQMNVS